MTSMKGPDASMAKVDATSNVEITGRHLLDEEQISLAPDQFDPKYATSRLEIWSWYVYYIGNSGLTLFNYAPTAFQNLVSQAAGPSGMLHFAGRLEILWPQCSCL